MSQKWTRITIAVFIVAVAVISAYLGIKVSKQNAEALHAPAHHTSSFTAYVLVNHIGTIESRTGGLGLDSNALELQIPHAIAQNQERAFALAMFKKFHALDGGTSLSIVQKDEKTGGNTPVAEVVYDPQSRVLDLILHHGKTTEEFKTTLAE